MRVKWTMGAVAVAVIGLVGAPAGLASADETAQETISRLQSQGYTVNIDRVGTAPLDQCVVTSVRNPQQVKQWVPYTGPGRGNGNDRVLVQVVTSQTVSVSLNCQG
ncbi:MULTISPECIES: hypothetical protein [Mycobacteriaceae]|jgi:hypothetical protein|uniref:PASTA domain-containing protein n=1 Tax=Mycobacterium dioxanotrophicus TaxID=482462 RepID=A0A1Y0C025_9MYCO|nr:MULTISPECIES: hypothetical protein [Mycobacterium]ART68529.1 hypothetical protein BTO20_08030 [Mycobacterium dioxanotrophicus]OBC02404.1 hypothetical protein A5784_15950 [Mycobacterium sp. 852013-50091_SCH5140682]